VVEFGVEPGHGERGGAAGAAAHGGAAVGVGGEGDVRLLGGAGQHFGLDEVGVGAGDGVILEPALAALSVAAAGIDEDRQHRRQPLLVDHRVQRRHERLEVAAPVLGHNERGGGAGDVLLRHVDPHLALVGHDALLVLCDAGVGLVVGRVHDELVDGAAGDAVFDGQFRCVGVVGADGEFAVGELVGRIGVRPARGGGREEAETHSAKLPSQVLHV